MGGTLPKDARLERLGIRETSHKVGPCHSGQRVVSPSFVPVLSKSIFFKLHVEGVKAGETRGKSSVFPIRDSEVVPNLEKHGANSIR